MVGLHPLHCATAYNRALGPGVRDSFGQVAELADDRRDVAWFKQDNRQ